MDVLSRLIDALRCLPGIGPKSAQRMAYYLLQHQRSRGLHLASCLTTAMQSITHCQRCNNYTTDELCNICQKANRDPSLLCVVENPSDLYAIEQTGVYTGYYYVLMGKLSPMDGIGPDQIALDGLKRLVEHTEINEVILALSSTIEGQTTVQFIRNMLKNYQINLTQPAHGLPSGGELEFLDSNTIGSALRNRSVIDTTCDA